MDRKRVLIIDDDDSLALALRVRLEAAGLAVSRADGGIHGLAIAFEEHPDCITLDLRMPGMDGHEVLGRLRTNPSTARTPVVVVSANVQDEARRRSREAGATHFVGKPYNAAQLLELIRQTIAEHTRPEKEEENHGSHAQAHAAARR